MKVYHCLTTFCFLVLASCSRIDFEQIEIGKPYVGVCENKDCAVVFDRAEEKDMRGRLYFDEGSPVAEPELFTANLKKKGKGNLQIAGSTKPLKRVSLKRGKLQGKTDGKSFSLTLQQGYDERFRPMYQEPCYKMATEKRTYARNVKGFWMSYPDTGEDFGNIYLGKVMNLLTPKDLDLDMDLYYPGEPDSLPRPLLVLIHGGAFYNGDKQAEGYPEMGRHFAERGYVVASINYRLGFKPLAADVERAGYRALQDAHAAVCYLIAHAKEFGIDTTKIFAAGTSAGAITALNLAFMHEENRPETTREGGTGEWISNGINNITKEADNVARRLLGVDLGINDLCRNLGLEPDLGPIGAVSQPRDRQFEVKAVVNMWGAAYDLGMLSNSPNTSILSFHGNADRIVPYAYGYPFDGVLDPYVDKVFNHLPSPLRPIAVYGLDWVSNGKPIHEFLFNPMQGSKAIHDKACTMHMRSELYTAPGRGHSLHVDEHRNLTGYFTDSILPVMTRFLCEEMAGGTGVRLQQSGTWYEATGTDNVAELHWRVEGGAIVTQQGENRSKVLFFSDTPRHAITAEGRYKNGVEFSETMVVP